ncbi:MAG TPA: class I SAM-dependent methyltransferase [Acidiferrobacterales bacterium]|nr:class I SAM-dependent methyltransferase [Acidiferrobacterales bacterium]
MLTIVPESIETYAAAHSTPQSSLLRELEEYTRAHCAYPGMLIGRLEGALLQMLVHLTGVCRILEIGLFTGYSALTMAEALPADGELISCEVNPDTAAIAQSFFDRSPHGHKIKIRLGRALNTLRSLEANTPFDLVFLDADKENYGAYYDLVLPMLRPGRLIVADNVLWSGRVLAPEQESDHALVAFNRRVQEDSTVENVVLTVRDGVMLIRKK